MAKEVRSDAVQRRAQRPLPVEALPVCVGGGGRLRSEIVGEPAPDPTAQIALQRRILLAKRLSEATTHTVSFPLGADRFQRLGMGPKTAKSGPSTAPLDKLRLQPEP